MYYKKERDYNQSQMTISIHIFVYDIIFISIYNDLICILYLYKRDD